jgi:hypothetical protein
LAGIGYGNGAYGSWLDPELLLAVEVPGGEDPEEDMVVLLVMLVAATGCN